MRIIAGKLKGRQLQGPPADSLDIRPTSDKAREALFSILPRWPTGPFVDLFAGTGAVAVEAWSRGYAPVVCVERMSAAIKLAERNAMGTDVRVMREDVRTLRPDTFSGLAVLFADPPYADALQAWQDLAERARSWMEPGGIVVWETAVQDTLPHAEGWELQDSRRYGATRFHILRVK